jgi:diguanylate cyclase (GGDEF)-like protein
MKFSIDGVFKNIKFYFVIMTALLALISFIELSRQASFDKIQQLEEQKVLVNKIYQLGRNDLDYSLINTQGIGAQLKTNLSFLTSMTTNDFFGNILGLNDKYKNKIEKLSLLEDAYISNANNYYQKKDENIAQKFDELTVSKTSLLNQLNEMIVSDINEDYKKFSITQWIIYATLFLMLAGAWFYSKKLTVIYEDIRSLFAIGSERSPEAIQTQEVNTIKMRMIRKPSLSQAPSMIDPVTDIKNYKGMMQAYSEKKGIKENNYTAVCVFEIDNFKELEKNLSKEYTQSVLKKISFILSLYEQPTDVIARIEYDQFAVILSRETKIKAFDDCEAMRKSIDETVFNNPKGGTVAFTLSGGLVIKANNKSLEDAIKEAKEILQTAKANGKNRIAQIRVHAERF